MGSQKAVLKVLHWAGSRDNLLAEQLVDKWAAWWVARKAAYLAESKELPKVEKMADPSAALKVENWAVLTVATTAARRAGARAAH